MARPLAPASPNDVANVDLALARLRAARSALADTGAVQALAKVNAAIKSTEGALRHVARRARATAAEAKATREHYTTTGESLKRDAHGLPADHPHNFTDRLI